MGVNLGNIVPKEEIKFEDLKNKVVGIDAFNALYQFLSSIRGQDGSLLQDSRGNVTSHLQGLFSRTLNLMGKGIKLVYVFDGKAPELKSQQRQARDNRKIAAEHNYNEAKDEEDLELMYKYSKQFLRLNSEMINESKELIIAMGIPVVQAPSEAEGQVAFMCKNKDIDFAASQDYDSVLFGAPKLIRNLTLSQKRKINGGRTVFTFLEFVELEKTLKELNISHNQLIILGILSGTDFNIGGVRGIGPKKALTIVKRHTDTEEGFDELFKELNVDFNWKEVYNIFKNLPVDNNYKLKWNDLDEEKVKEILIKRHDFNLERIQSLLDKYSSENKLKGQKGLGEFF